MLDASAQGVYPIAPTPFQEDGSIDWISVARMMDFYLASGVKGVTVLGIMGEAPKLDQQEALQITTDVVKRANGIKVVVGISAPGFAAMRWLARAAMDIGASGVMIAPPSTLKTDDQIVAYFSQAAEAIGSDVPIVVQDYPLSTGVVMTPDVIWRIVFDNPSCVMLKHEDWPGLEKISSLRAMQKEGRLRPISILVGNGGMFLDMEMRRGADGAMTGYAFPEMQVDVVSQMKAGREEAAQTLFNAHLPLLRYEQQPGVGLAIRKYVMTRRGIIGSATQRKPGSVLTPLARKEVDYLLGCLAKIDSRAGKLLEQA